MLMHYHYHLVISGELTSAHLPVPSKPGSAIIISNHNVLPTGTKQDKCKSKKKTTTLSRQRACLRVVGKLLGNNAVNC